MGPQATDVCSFFNLFDFLKLCLEVSFQRTSALWNIFSAGKNIGFLLIDSYNGYKRYSQIQMLLIIFHEWPVGTKFVFYFYNHQALILLWDPGKTGFVLFSKEGFK